MNIKVNGKIISLSQEILIDIEAIYLFGSVARGDSDEYSDIDVFIVIDDCSEEEFINKKKIISRELKIPSDWISLYRYKKIKEMHTYGSYFLCHIKCEGKLLYSRTGKIVKLLDALPKYSRVSDDLMEYTNICEDIKKSIELDDLTLEYELALLASLARNTCIAIAYLNDIMDFGRNSVIKTCQHILKDEFPFSIEEYEVLYQYRIKDTRGFENINKNADKRYVQEWLDKINKLIKYAQNMNRREF